jgi:hypothetical protein
MSIIVYTLIALALLVLLVPRAQPKKKPFDWSRRHTRWSRWRARNAFTNR